MIILSKLSSRSPRLAPDTSPSENVIKVPRQPHAENGRKSLPKRRLPETSESSSQESSSDGEDRIMTNRKQFGPACSTSKMSARLSSALKVNAAAGGKVSAPKSKSPNGAGASDADQFSSASVEMKESLCPAHSPQPSTSGSSSADGHPGRPEAAKRLGGASPSLPQNFPQNSDPSSPHTLPVRDGMPSIRPNAMKNRQKQLEALRRHEERIRSKINQPLPGANAGRGVSAAAAAVIGALGHAPSPSLVELIQNPMYVHALDTSKAVTEEEVRWHDVSKDFTGFPPEEKMFYSLTPARGELVMFGGIKSDLNTMHRTISTQGASNMTYLLRAKPKLR